MWIDSHCHFNDPDFAADWETAADRALAAGVETFLVAGFDLPSSRLAVELAQKRPEIWAAVGIHPHDAKTWDESTAAEIWEMLHGPRVVALGETGLDYYYNHSTRDQQLAAFRAQLEMAREAGKPVIIHTREAHQDTLDLLKGYRPVSGVMHCFTGSREMGLEYLKLGMYISFAGALTFKNADKLRETAAALPLDRLLVETDAPYMTPHPYRGQRNEPRYVALVGEKLAEVQNKPVQEVAAITAANTRKLFGL